MLSVMILLAKNRDILKWSVNKSSVEWVVISEGVFVDDAAIEIESLTLSLIT